MSHGRKQARREARKHRQEWAREREQPLYVVYDGRWYHDPNSSTVMEAFHAQDDEEATRHFHRIWSGENCILTCENKSVKGANVLET